MIKSSATASARRLIRKITTLAEGIGNFIAISGFGCLEQPNTVAYTGIMNRWRSIVSVLIALWLPLQGYGAVAMPFCEHGPAMPDASAAVSAHVGAQDGHHGLTGVSHHENEGDSRSASSDNSTDRHAGLGCNDCGACQLACAPLIVSTVAHFATTGSPVYDPLPVASLTSISPEQLQRPPLPAFV